MLRERRVQKHAGVSEKCKAPTADETRAESVGQPENAAGHGDAVSGKELTEELQVGTDHIATLQEKNLGCKE